MSLIRKSRIAVHVKTIVMRLYADFDNTVPSFTVVLSVYIRVGSR